MNKFLLNLIGRKKEKKGQFNWVGLVVKMINRQEDGIDLYVRWTFGVGGGSEVYTCKGKQEHNEVDWLVVQVSDGQEDKTRLMEYMNGFVVELLERQEDGLIKSTDKLLEGQEGKTD